MARDLVASTATAGWIILSGILNEQANLVEARFVAHGAARARRLVIEDWTTLIMRA
jgi:ribosomal protein L11 methyltransferase